MHQTFDRSVPLSEQRYRVACKKSKRNHPKRHGTSNERIKKAKKARGKRAYARGVQKHKQSKQLKKARAFWRGEWL